MSFNPDMGSVKHIHFIGIGGAGMSGIAEVMINQGYEISGSDLNENMITQHLSDLGVRIIKEHAKENIIGSDLIVLSSAIPQDNPEVNAATAANIPIIPRAQMLAMLMQAKYGIAVSGTHGKTTTTSLVASVLTQAELHPTFVIGGLLKSVGAHAQLGTGQYFVAEADESDASFLLLKPKIAIITNIDDDHLNTYNHEISQLRSSFLKFVADVPADGLIIVCADDPRANSLLPEIHQPVLTYGFNSNADIQIIVFKQCGLQSHFTVQSKKTGKKSSYILNLAGKHNALNALAAIAVGAHLNIPEAIIATALQNFMGIGRRFQMYGECAIPSGKVLLIDDYGHHPREIAATLDAIRLVWPTRRLVMAYQPHRYTRTQALMQDFAAVLSSSDVLLLLDVYSAGEERIAEADGASLCRAIAKFGKLNPVFVTHIHQLPTVAKDILRDGDILLLQGAGSIGTMAAKMAAMQTLG